MMPYELLGKFINVLENEGFPPISQSAEFFSKFCKNNGVATPVPREILNLKDTFMRGIKNRRTPFWVKNNPPLLGKYQKLMTMYHNIYKPKIMQPTCDDSSARTRPLQWPQLFAKGVVPVNRNYIHHPMESVDDEMPHLVPLEKTMEERLLEMVNNEIEQNPTDAGSSDLFKQQVSLDNVEQLKEHVRSRSEIIHNQANALREATVKLNNVMKQLRNYEAIIINKSKVIEDMSKELRESKQSYTKLWNTVQQRAKSINYQRVKMLSLEKALNTSTNTDAPKKLVVRRMPKTNLAPIFASPQSVPIKKEEVDTPQSTQSDIELVELE